jgi:primary-amine oxidase
MDEPPPQQQAGGGCEPHSPLPGGLPSGPGSGTAVYQQFPPSGPMKTAWFVTFDHAVHRGLFITSAFFKPAPNRDWIKVLSDAGPSEIFVPYQSGDPRYLDLAHPSEGGAGEFGLIRASQRDAGRCGQVIGRNNAVVRELTEKGVLWKINQLVYRGHKMTLWGTLGSGNYNYMLSYAFNDDGTIEFRGGATATNLPSKPFEAHMHNIIWRVNVDLNGAKNTVSVVRHIENTNSPTWRDVVEPYNNNREGGIELNPREFTTLHVMAQGLKNARGSQSGYMILPMYRGTARHMESWMRRDVWVTRYKPQEIGFQFIERYANNEPIANEDVVIWLVTSSLHIARDEDGQVYRRQGQQPRFIGAAVTMWAGFDMKPHNVMDNTPFLPEFK